MNQTVLLILIGAVVLVVLLLPLLRRGDGAAHSPALPGSGPGGDAPDVPDELAELELDYQMGRLSEADYLELRGRAVASADVAVAAVVPAADEVTAMAPPPSRPALSRDLDDRAEAMIRRERERSRAECPSCGERPEPGARFCSSCGTRLAVCPSCGQRPADPGARFCVSCGSSMNG